MKRQDTREIAIEALKRGLLSAEEVWDLAARGGPAPEGRGAAQAAKPVAAPGVTLRVFPEPQAVTAPLEPLGAGSEVPSLTSATIPAASEGLFPIAPVSGARDLASLPGHLDGPRYAYVDFLGRGGMGKVTQCRDREIGRTVAVKTLSQGSDAEAHVAARFLQEARITAQLEHPNIVPVYDLGALPDGQLYYTMRVVKRQSLGDVLDDLELRRQWPMVRLLGAFLQVCHALSYAHSRGVLHGDIKPDNILLGDFGEVYLADWGLAKVSCDSVIRERLQGSSPPPAYGSPSGGTPGYLAPEVALGQWDTVDHRSDLFALGVILYEILTGQPPFGFATDYETLLAAYERDPVPPRRVAAGVPLLLEDLCLALLAKDPAERVQTADEVVERVEGFLEGAKEKERRRSEAERLCVDARAPMQRYHDAFASQGTLRESARAAARDVAGWERVERKRVVWALEDKVADAERQSALALAEAIELLTKALGYDAECPEAHAGLSELYWSRAREAERRGHAASQVYYEALVLEHDDGTFAALLRAEARLSLVSNPPGARVFAQRYEERDRMLVPGNEKNLGRTPFADVRLEPGSYLLTVTAPGFRAVRRPVLLTRDAHQEIRVNLYRDEEIGEGFCYVPGGHAWIGGDDLAFEPLPRQWVEVPDFAISEFPVTMREYCAYLDDLSARGSDEVHRRAPHDLKGSEGFLVSRDSGRWLPSDALIEGEARTLYPPEAGHALGVPVCLVDWFDARAYCRWLGEQRGMKLRLPTELQWEKAARGVDGRAYPWGNSFDPTFCLMRESRSFPPQPEPVGAFPGDCSPFGVRDTAGGMREWVGDVHGEMDALTLDAEEEPGEGVERGESGWRMVRGGAWVTDRNWCRGASRGGLYAGTRGTGLTFRVVRELKKSRQPSG